MLPLVVCREKWVVIISTGGRNELRDRIRVYHKLINQMCPTMVIKRGKSCYSSKRFAVHSIAYTVLKKFRKCNIL